MMLTYLFNSYLLGIYVGQAQPQGLGIKCRLSAVSAKAWVLVHSGKIQPPWAHAILWVKLSQKNAPFCKVKGSCAWGECSCRAHTQERRTACTAGPPPRPGHPDAGADRTAIQSRPGAHNLARKEERCWGSKCTSECMVTRLSAPKERNVAQPEHIARRPGRSLQWRIKEVLKEPEIRLTEWAMHLGRDKNSPWLLCKNSMEIRPKN